MPLAPQHEFYNELIPLFEQIPTENEAEKHDFWEVLEMALEAEPSKFDVIKGLYEDYILTEATRKGFAELTPEMTHYSFLDTETPENSFSIDVATGRRVEYVEEVSSTTT